MKSLLPLNTSIQSFIDYLKFYSGAADTAFGRGWPIWEVYLLIKKHFLHQDAQSHN